MLGIALLGPFSVRRDGEEVRVTAPLQRALLAALALSPGRSLSVDQLIDGLWLQPPEGAVNGVQQYVSALRRSLGRESLVTVGRGYRLEVDRYSVDAERFRDLTREAGDQHRRLGVNSAARLYREALDLWRGLPLAGLPDCPFVDGARGELERELLEAQLAWLSVENDLGHGARVVAQAESLATRHPLDESVLAVWMRCLAEAGRQSDALAVYQRARTRLREELGVDPGDVLQKTHSAVLRHDRTVVVTARETLDSSDLPRPVNELVGRADDLAALERMLTGRARLVTLSGPGGVGKTRLAVEVARRAAADREVIYVPLATLSTADLVLQSLAAALRVKPGPSAALVTQLATALEGRDVLIVLDNFEHVVAAAAEVAEVLVRTELPTQFVVTSRESLRIAGEQVFPLRSLSTDHEGGHVVAPAVELFWQRAEAANRAFDRAAEPEVVAEICRQLDGLPLGIELAASRTSVLSASRMLERLSNRLGLLTTGSRDAPDRQKSLRACVAWSVDLLDEPERLVFAEVSVFKGGATLPTIEEVIRAVHRDLDVLTAVESLVAKNLMVSSPTNGGVRLAMLETIREYAREQLALSGHRDQIVREHALSFHRRYGSGSDTLGWPPRTVVEAAEWAEDLPNLRKALTTLERLGELEMYADLVVGLSALWRSRSLWEERKTHLDHVTHSPQVSLHRRVDALLLSTDGGAVPLAHKEAMLAEIHELMSSSADVDAIRECHLALRRAALAYFRGDDDGAERETLLAREAADRSGNDELRALADSFGGLPELENSLAVARRCNNQFLERGLLLTLSEAALESVDAAVLERARGWGREAHDLGILLGDADLAGMALANAATAWLLLGGPAQEVSRDLRKAMRAVRQATDHVIQVENLVRLAASEAAQGHDDLAQFLFDAWQALSADQGLGIAPSNQRVIDTFLPRVDRSNRSPALVDLSTAVQVALGERALDTVGEMRHRA